MFVAVEIILESDIKRVQSVEQLDLSSLSGPVIKILSLLTYSVSLVLIFPYYWYIPPPYFLGVDII